jgi:hypothetical protein
VTRLRPGRRFTNLGRMCSEVGWKHWDTIKTLEAKRKTKSSAFWAKKKEVIQVAPPPRPSNSCHDLHLENLHTDLHSVSASKRWPRDCVTRCAFAAAEEGGQAGCERPQGAEGSEDPRHHREARARLLIVLLKTASSFHFSTDSALTYPTKSLTRGVPRDGIQDP